MKKRVYSGDRARKQKDSDWPYFEDCIICQGMKKAKEKGVGLG